MNVSSATTSFADWAQLRMQRATSSAPTSQTDPTDPTGQTGEQLLSFSMDDSATPPPPPPLPMGSGVGDGPGASDLQLPTTSLGGHHGHVHGSKDPLASLDADGDGSVSSEEFGLSSASDAEKSLFSAIDMDGSGSLSSAELSDFKAQMTPALASMQAGTCASGDGSSSTSSNSSGNSSSKGNSSSSSSAALQAMLQRISQDDLSLSASGYFGASSGDSVNLTA